MKIALFGYGKMGKIVAQIAKARNHHIVASLKEAQVCIDFSAAESVIDHVKSACEMNIPIVIGTTGWEENLPTAQDLIINNGNAALYAPNFSIGVALFRTLLKKARHLFSEFEISGKESHHQQKRDAPSGTAKAIAEDLKMPVPFSSVRCGSIVGKHEIVFDSSVDIITLTHKAKNREGFALGAVKAAEWIRTQKGWFVLDDMLHSNDYTVQSRGKP